MVESGGANLTIFDTLHVVDNIYRMKTITDSVDQLKNGLLQQYQ